MSELSRLVEQPGAVTISYSDAAFPDRPLLLHSACPQRFTVDTPVVLVHHGVGRNGKDYRNYWLDLVDEASVLAISIEFPEAYFPEYLMYNFGNLHTKEGRANPREQWTYGIDERLFDALRVEGITACDRYGLFGHSAGGQFVHRMVSFGYREHVAIAISANAGTYAMPDLMTAWPFGLGDVGLDQAALRSLLEFPLIVMAGTLDTETAGKFFPKGPRSMLQGAHRYERAHNYVRAAHAAAAALGIACKWAIVDVPDVGHDGAGMTRSAAPIIAAALNVNC